MDRLRFFQFRQLPPHLQGISAAFADLAEIVEGETVGDQRELAMTLLLQAKDAAVRGKMDAIAQHRPESIQQKEI